MNKKALDKLVKTLGMQVDLAPILESNGGYERFEMAVNNLLNEKIQEIYLEPTKYTGIYKINIMKNFPGNYHPLLKTVEDFKKAYGIGCELKTQSEIARERGVSRQAVSCLTCYLIKILSHPKRKEKIWYESL